MSIDFDLFVDQIFDWITCFTIHRLSQPSAEFSRRLDRIQNMVNQRVHEITQKDGHHIHDLASLIRISKTTIPISFSLFRI